MGCTPQTLHEWVSKVERDQGLRPGLTSDERERMKALERENRELRQANEILRKAYGVFYPGGARPPTEVMIAFIDENRDEYGVEPICKTLSIAPSTYFAHVARRQRPETAPPRVHRDARLSMEIRRVFYENFQFYGVRKVWRQLSREGFSVARCTVARLMKVMGIAGVIRGKPHRTTFSDKATSCPLDRVNRDFQAPAPNVLWVADFTYVSTSAGFVFVVTALILSLE